MDKLREIRQKGLNATLIALLISVVISIIAFTVNREYLFIGLISLVLPIIVFASYNKKFTKVFKDEFVKASLESIFDNLYYDPARGLDRNIIANTGMLYMGNRYSSNDYISGSYKNVPFEQADVCIQDVETHTDSEGHTHTDVTNILVGKWMIFDFNKSFKANVQVKSKFFSFSKLSIKRGETKYNTVKMEDEDFNKKFSVHAQSEHDAFYILTPQLMQRIKELNEGLKGKIMLCFIDNKLHVALNNSKDSFEYNMLSKLDENVINEYVSKEIKIITDFVDKLNLENDIFKKEG